MEEAPFILPEEKPLHPVAEFFLRLTSRKFLLAVAAFIVAAVNQEWYMALGVVLGYLGVEGAGDIADRIRE
jgi:hypothetical protein